MLAWRFAYYAQEFASAFAYCGELFAYWASKFAYVRICSRNEEKIFYANGMGMGSEVTASLPVMANEGGAFRDFPGFSGCSGWA